MSRRRRVFAAIFVACLCAPGTFLRTPVSWDPPAEITAEQIQTASDTDVSGWSVEGVWHLEGESLIFGGFSSLIALPDNRLMSLSDRGARFTLGEPDQPNSEAHVIRQTLAVAGPSMLADIEAATRDPESGMYWASLENNHGIHRFAADHTPEGILKLDAKALGWTNNTGAEVMTRLQDGRFVILPEGRRTGLIFSQDPLEQKTYSTFDYLPPIPGHAATDMAQLPDGRVMLLLRNLDPTGGMPPFESKLAIGPAPQADSEEPWAPKLTLDLAGVIPRDNYEGLAVRALEDGRVAVWLISDDNLSVMQRTLVAKLTFDPGTNEE
ncbi:esterase-like activity of phytase family protein [Erythrobacter crassostreae]|uniref:Esterase-like activity of phytase family protein n=1 Tax=Erythrobacter crassostreae TaxID=2828328 RepID=A0A9X1F263_9SPHN|nr:esterase-like activity of phytase family protein [Erythrobacter crassostrea]MBV7258636.1 esterase-like activity of phytase family protein [Erythrobacter crassostrea]